MKPFRLAMIGAGYRAQNSFAPVLPALADDLELVGVYSRTQESAQRFGDAHNVPWFTVRPDDFPNPELAKEILAAYGEDRGDGTQRLYRFPVVFPADRWQAVMPHELVAWGANEKRFWSE